MANKQDFTPEEWTKILQSPMLVGIAVSMADPSGLWGALKEAAAGSAEIGTAKRDASANALIKAVITDINTPDGRSALQNALKSCFADAEPAQCVERSLANLHEVSAILNAKSPADAAASKLGCAPSVRKWRRPRPKVRSSASGGRKSAMPRRPRSPTSPRRCA